MVIPSAAETWVLTMPWPKPPRSLNDRGHWAKLAQEDARIRAWACAAATEALIPPLVSCSVEMVWVVPDRRHRDEENPVATFKPACDGFVDAGVVPDDTPDWMAKLMPRIVYRPQMSLVQFFITGIVRSPGVAPIGSR